MINDHTLVIANRLQGWPRRWDHEPRKGVFFILSSMYHQRRFLRDGEPSAVFWFDQSVYCYDERWGVAAIPWRGSKEKRGWQCLTWLPEKAGKALHTAIAMTLRDREPRGTVLFLNTMGITFENHFWIVPSKEHEVMAIMRQRPFQPTQC